MSVPFLTIDQTQDIVKDVVNQVTRSVTGTMGPNGTLVLIKNGTSKKVTKDGVTVAKSIKFEDPRAELVNKVLTEPAIKTDDECGDGTTTTIFLTSGLYEVYAKHRGFRQQRLIDEVGNKVIAKLVAQSIRIDNTSKELFQMAMTSSNSDRSLSELVTEIYREAGENFPEIEIKESLDVNDRYQRTNGITLPLTFSSPAFSTGGSGVYQEFIPVILDGTLRNNEELLPTLNELHKKYQSARTIVFVARSVEHEAISVMMASNNQLGDMRFVALQTNAGGSVGTLIMEDIGVMFNAPMFNQLVDSVNRDIPKVRGKIQIRGNKGVLVVDDVSTRIRIDERVDEIKKQMDDYEASERFSPRARFNQKRIRDLKGELVTVYVGGNTISEVKERVDRFEDVVKAVKSGLINGILPGVGTALFKAGCAVINEYDAKSPSEETLEILLDLRQVFESQYLKLAGSFKCNDNEELVVTDLTSGEEGTPSELGIYDTAYASITALRGGLQTAKILASLDSLIISDKLSAVSIDSV